MKKALIWITLLVVIVAVVLVAVFAVQKDSLSTEVSKLQADKEDLSRQLTEVDMAVKTAQELAETMVKEAEEKVTVVTAERDALQASAETAAAQLDAGIKQLKETLTVLGVQDSEAQLSAELEETKNNLTAMTAERDALAAAVENAKVDKAAAVIKNVEGETVRELDALSEMKLEDLPAGEYTVTVTVYTAGGEEAAQYAFPYSSALELPQPEAAPEEVPAEEEPVPAEDPVPEEVPAEAETPAEPVESEQTEDDSANKEAEEPAAQEEPAAEPEAEKAPDAA